MIHGLRCANGGAYNIGVTGKAIILRLRVVHFAKLFCFALLCFAYDDFFSAASSPTPRCRPQMEPNTSTRTTATPVPLCHSCEPLPPLALSPQLPLLRDPRPRLAGSTTFVSPPYPPSRIRARLCLPSPSSPGAVKAGRRALHTAHYSLLTPRDPLLAAHSGSSLLLATHSSRFTSCTGALVLRVAPCALPPALLLPAFCLPRSSPRLDTHTDIQPDGGQRTDDRPVYRTTYANMGPRLRDAGRRT